MWKATGLRRSLSLHRYLPSSAFVSSPLSASPNDLSSDSAYKEADAVKGREMQAARGYADSSSRPEVTGPWSLHTRSVQDIQYGTAMQQLVVTASGPDRPGIVARLTKRVLECGANVEESRMARLAGDFTILMLITFDVTLERSVVKFGHQASGVALVEGLKAKEGYAEQRGRQNSYVNTRWTSDDRLKETRPNRKFRKFLLRGADNPGLMYNVTEYLASHGINIETLETSTEEVPVGGVTLFMMEGVIAMPVKLSTRKLIHNLDTLQTTLGVNIAISNLAVPANFKYWNITPSLSISS